MTNTKVAAACKASVKIRIKFLENLSAITPAKGDTIIIGTKFAKVASDRIKELPVVIVKYQITAKLTIWLPISEKYCELSIPT